MTVTLLACSISFHFFAPNIFVFPGMVAGVNLLSQEDDLGALEMFLAHGPFLHLLGFHQSGQGNQFRDFVPQIVRENINSV